MPASSGRPDLDPDKRPNPVPQIGQRDVGAEWNLARAPMWRPVRRGLPREPRAGLALWRHPFSLTSTEAWPDYRDFLLHAHLCTRFIRQGCPLDRVVSTTLTAAAGQMGLQGIGGSGRTMVRRALRRLRSLTIESAIRSRSGTTAVLGWGLIDSYAVRPDGVTATLSEQLAASVTNGGFVKMDSRVLLNLAGLDLLALRVWVFLEAENLQHAFRFRVFGAADEVPTSHNLPPIVVLLQVSDSNRSRVVSRLLHALQSLESCDPQYTVALEPSASGEDWNLVAQKRRSRANGVGQAGRMAYGRKANGVRGGDQDHRYRRPSPPIFTDESRDVGSVPVSVGGFLDRLVAAGLDPRISEELAARRPLHGRSGDLLDGGTE